jgi:hypothetical protein
MNKKTIIKIASALLFNAIVGGVIATLLGCSPMGGAAVACLIAIALPGFMPEDAACSGVLTEVWTGELIKALRGKLDAAWLNGVPDQSSIVNNEVIHLVDVGADPQVLVNNTTYPLDIQELEDGDKTFSLDKFQTKVTKSKLIEVSVVDIGGNDDAIVLTHEGKTISLSAGRDSIDGVLPLLDNVSKTPLKKKEMELKDLAIKLGLKETATEEEVNQKLVSLSLAAGKVSALETQVQTLQAQQQAVELAAITRAVETAITEKRLAAGMKEHFIELGKKLGLDQLNITLSAMQPQGKITATLHRTDNGNIVAEPQDYSKYEKLSAVPANVMMDLHDNHHDEFVRLYKAEYEFEPA